MSPLRRTRAVPTVTMCFLTYRSSCIGWNRALHATSCIWLPTDVDSVLRGRAPPARGRALSFRHSRSSKSVYLNERGRQPRAHACGQADLEAKLSAQRYAVKEYFPVLGLGRTVSVCALELERDAYLGAI